MNQSPSFPRLMQYVLEHQGTQLGTGQFACLPLQPVDFEDALQYIQDHPNDDFMHTYLLHLAGQFGPNLVAQLIERAKEEEDPHLMTLLYEVCTLNERLQNLTGEFDGIEVRALAPYSPLIYVPWSRRKGSHEQDYWLKLFSENILRHTPPKGDGELAFPVPYEEAAIAAWASKVVPIEALGDQGKTERSARGAGNKPSALETAAKAMDRLAAIDFKTGPETENPASLSPYALQMQWVMQIQTSTGRNHWELAGLQTSYGKGLTADAARASCCMEIVERVSSFASFDAGRALHYKKDHALTLARYDDLTGRSGEALDPNEMRLEVPYENQALYWITGEGVDERGAHPVFVPAQLVFLFCNLDEICLTSGLPSTGLASGNTMEEAKLHALLEVIERDAEKIVPYSPHKCFLLESDIPGVREVVDRSRDQGVEVVFLDITSELGVPCYKAFIQGPNGEILKGSAAHLDGRRAAVSALTEVPFHSSWFHPAPPPEGLSRIQDRALPNYGTGDAGRDLELLEKLLMKNGYGPIYVDLTRQDLGIPAVKALVPGLELFAEFDSFSTLSLRQFAHYRRARA
jgi:ribosomal protein S12 methylthiotransferase accessory factor